jgi:hypothetical protein
VTKPMRKVAVSVSEPQWTSCSFYTISYLLPSWIRKGWQISANPRGSKFDWICDPDLDFASIPRKAKK